MSVSDWLAVIAIVVSAGALSLEVRRWVESRPRLHLRMMADAIEIPSDDDSPKLALFVTNRGSEPTTITHMIAFAYASRWGWLRGKPTKQGVVNSPNVPAEVGINRQWMGKMLYTDDFVAARAKGLLYVGVIASHSNKNYLMKVPPRSPDLPKLSDKAQKRSPPR